MKKIVIILTVLAFLSVGCGDGKLIRYDGVYFMKITGLSQKNEVLCYTEYIRFYEDGTVIITNSTGTISQIKEWFNKENTKIDYKEKYEIVKNKISFQTTTVDGKVDYDGQIYDNKLILNWNSTVNGKNGTEEYFFSTW